MTSRLPYQTAFFTGPSDPRCCSLSPSQSKFISSLGLPWNAIVDLNFPYFQPTPNYRDVPLLQASINNLMTYFRARNTAFQKRNRPAVLNLIDRAELTIFLMGSCGLEIFSNLKIPTDMLQRVRIFAYGPVTRNLPDCQVLLVQGRTDKLSRCFSPPAHHYVDCGHMTYLTNNDVLAMCKRYIAEQVQLYPSQSLAPV